MYSASKISGYHAGDNDDRQFFTYNGLSPNSLGETEENIEKEVLGFPKHCQMTAEFDTLWTLFGAIFSSHYQII